jgi:alpha-galactosidase
MLDMIPLVKRLGFKMVTVDAGWFYKNGDFTPRDDTFPDGEKGMKKFVQAFHDAGLKIKLWLTTDIAGPGLEEAHPEWLIRNEKGEAIGFDYLGSQVTPYLCPALKEVQEYHRTLVRKFIGEWGYDGFKIDQNLINSTARCYAKDHHHRYPEESVEALPQIYRAMYEEMAKLNPEAIFEVCPCGMFPSFYKMPFYNQPVSSDFNSAWQIRHRGKTIKALMGPDAAYFGDHVERHFTENNFPSMIGVGGIPGSMMVSRPEDNVEFLRAKYPCYLSPEREKHFEKWLGIYNEYQLSKGEYLNLYDIAYDCPETHVIKKDGIMYYAFYADQWRGEVEFRGLEDRDYTIVDYANEKELGTIHGNGKLKVDFDENLLVKAIPQ